MFTGIVTDIGEVVGREDGRFTIRAGYPAASLEVGASMACDGCCLTMTSVRARGQAAASSPSTPPMRRAPRPRSPTGPRAGASIWSAPWVRAPSSAATW